MGLSEFFHKVDLALLEGKSVGTIRGMLFSLLDQTEALEENLRLLEALPDSEPFLKENDRLRAQLNEASDTIEYLQAEARERNQNQRPEIQDDILYCIACLGPHTTSDLVESMDLTGASINFHLDQLQSGFLLGIDHEFQWTLLRDGRRYLTHRELLPIKID